MKKKAIIIGNGYLPKKKQILILKKFDFVDIFCADGGANNLFKTKLNPQFIIGDLDSVKPEILDYYRSKNCQIFKISSQNNTDIEKVLDYLLFNGYSEAILFGATGDRLDHTIGNLSILIKYYERIKIHIIHYNSVLSCYFGETSFKVKPGEIISFYGLDNNTKFTTKGLKYNLQNELLYLGYRESTSNEAEEEEITITSNRKYLVIRDFYRACEYDYFN